MQNTAVIRRIAGQLAWYPPGAQDGPQWLNTEAEQEALRIALAQRKLSPLFAVPGAEARLLQLEVSPQERRHINKSLPFMLEEELAAEVDELHFAARPLDSSHYAVAVCSADNMRSYQAQLAVYPSISQWLPEPLLLPWQEGEWCLVLEGDGAIARTGHCEGFSIEREMLAAMLSAAALEGSNPDAVVIYGEQQEQDIALVPEQLQGKVQWRRGDLYAALLIADEPNPALNLRQGEFAQRLPLKRWWSQWRVAAVLFGAALALHLIATYADYHQLQQQNLSLRSAVQETYRKAFPRGAVVDAEKQLKRQLEALSGSSEGSGFVGLMEKVGKVVASSRGTSIVSINYNDKAGEMRLNIVAADYAAVEQVRAGIHESGLEAIMENSSAQGEKVRARLRVGEKS